MQIVKKDFKGETKLKPQSLDDLWALKHIVAVGDIVGAKTMRTVAVEEKERRPTFLKLKAEKIEFDESGQSLRIGGQIVAAREEFARGWHTFDIRPADVATIEKPEGWQEHQKRRLKEAAEYRVVNVMICVLDDRTADFALATELKLKPVATIRNRAGGKQFAAKGAEGQYFKEISDVLRQNLEKVDKIVIAGPGFTKENLLKALPDEIKSKCVTEHASVTGETGLNEVVKRGALDKIISGTRISKETELVENFLTQIAKRAELARFKKDEIESAADLGAIDTLLVSDRLVRGKEIESLMLQVEKTRGSVFIINSTHEAGEKLLGLGGLGAILRYKI